MICTSLFLIWNSLFVYIVEYSECDLQHCHKSISSFFFIYLLSVQIVIQAHGFLMINSDFGHFKVQKGQFVYLFLTLFCLFLCCSTLYYSPFTVAEFHVSHTFEPFFILLLVSWLQIRVKNRCHTFFKWGALKQKEILGCKESQFYSLP